MRKETSMEAPDFIESSYLCTGNPPLTPEKRHADSKPGDHFIIDDLFDFSNEDAVFGSEECTFDTITGNSTDSSIVTVVDSCNSSFSGSDPPPSGDLSSGNLPVGAHLPDELPLPYDEFAELDWFSHFEEESFSSEDLQKLQLISGMKSVPTDLLSGIGDQSQPANNNQNNNAISRPAEMSFPGKARSKRSRAAPCDWSSRLLVLSQTTETISWSNSDVASAPIKSIKKTEKVTAGRKKDNLGSSVGVAGAGEGRKCLHCATEKTPQWRTGPMGPKTLCNACGVRYKSGRLVPEYRPAASPTFVLAKHSNSHRKVLELRRQKEMQRSQQYEEQQFLYPNNSMFDLSSAGSEDYLIHHHTGPDFTQLI